MNKNVRDKRLNTILSKKILHLVVNTGNTIEMQKALATPIPPYIYFAGEHTIPEFIGSVHGAYISGERAAQKITQGTVNPTSTVTSNTVTVSTASALCKTYTWVALSLTVFILNREP